MLRWAFNARYELLLWLARLARPTRSSLCNGTQLYSLRWSPWPEGPALLGIVAPHAVVMRGGGPLGRVRSHRPTSYPALKRSTTDHYVYSAYSEISIYEDATRDVFALYSFFRNDARLLRFAFTAGQSNMPEFLPRPFFYRES